MPCLFFFNPVENINLQSMQLIPLLFEYQFIIFKGNAHLVCLEQPSNT